MINDSFLDWYKTEGFMKTSKRDIDIYALHLLISKNPDYIKKDLYEISNNLKISQSKVKLYLNEVQIRYAQLTPEDIILYIFETILNGSFSIDDEKKEIRLQINNNLAMDYLKYKLNVLMVYNDYSFNNSIVKISLNNFEKLLRNIKDESGVEKSISDKIIKFKKSLDNKIIGSDVMSAISTDIVGTIINLTKVGIENRDYLKKHFLSIKNLFINH